MSLISDIHNDLENSAIQLIAEYRARLFADAIRLCDNQASADDLVSRTFLKVISNIDQHRPDADFYSWMKAIMVNIHRNDLARPVARGTTPVSSDALETYAGTDNSTDEQILRNSDEEVVREALRHIDPEFKQLVLMRYYDEFSLKEIAGILNKPIGTVGRRIQIAHRLLAGKLSAKLGKKPVAILLAALLGVGTLFGAWVSPLGDWVAEKVFGNAPAVEAVSAQGVDDFSDNKQNETPQVGDQQQVADSQVQEGDETMNIKSAFTHILAAAVAAAGLGTSAETEIGSSSADNLEALPAEYARVDYLYSAGDVNAGNAPYIDLEYKATEKTGFEIDFEVLKVNRQLSVSVWCVSQWQ